MPDPADDAACIRARAEAAQYPLDEAALFINLVQHFAYRSRRAGLPGFGEVWLSWQTEPQWINVGTKGDPDRAAYLALAAPEIRPRIRFRRTSFDAQEARDAQERLFEALGPETGACGFSFEYESDWLVVDMEDNANEQTIRALLPADLASLVQLRRGGCQILL